MKIVFVGTFGMRPKGTMSVRALPMAQALTRRGAGVTLVVPPWDYPPDSGLELDLDGVKVVNICLPLRVPLYQHAAVTLKLLRRALAEKPDVVHFFKPKGYAAFAAMLLFLLKKLQRTQTRMVIDTDDWEGKGGWNDLAGYPWWQRALFAWQEEWCLLHAEGVTAASRELESMARRHGVKDVIYLPNGLPRQPGVSDAKGAAVRDRYALGEAPVLLLYTRFFEFRLERLITVLTLVKEQVPDFKLMVVGAGLHREEQEFKKMAVATGLGEQVIFAGWVETDKVDDYFSAADAALYPMDDTFLNRTKCPVKLIELLGAGLAVVAERVGEVAQYIESEENGVLVVPGNPHEFAAAVVRLLRDRPLRVRLGPKAAAKADVSYRWDTLIEPLWRAYH